MNMLEWLENWYSNQCDGDWEHQYGIKIDTLDNPGWRVDIDLADLDIEEKYFNEVQINRNENNWVFCKVKDRIFNGAGGPHNLQEILEIFKKWVES